MGALGTKRPAAERAPAGAAPGPAGSASGRHRAWVGGLASLALVASAGLAQRSAIRCWVPGPTLAIRAPEPSRADNDRRDSDCDGLSDAEEFASGAAGAGTDPGDWDTDGDGVADGVELGRAAPVDAACATTWVDADPTTRTDPTSPDSDGDALPDGLEDRNGNGRVDPGETDPGELDTDGDGLPDGAEDRNGNARLDAGETSPLRPDTDGDGQADGVEVARGTDPRRPDAIAFPEPMVYDLVRGLGAHRGEFEANVLFQAAPSRRLGGLLWSPEVEYAFAEGHALELEVPMASGKLHALKFGAQGTLGASHRLGAAHGWQGLVEYVPAEKGWLGSLTHVGALRLGGPWSAVTIVGAQYDRKPLAGERALRLVANASVFAESNAQLTWGLEGNLRAGGPGRLDWLVMPQAHVQLRPKWRLQAGLGVGRADERVDLVGASRLVVEL
ncbi:MAG TPA: hypothetical protein VFS43_17645 [Polyangiaceae bacterium]|nr:hypothetical protein [Polyangiaceae bacterium]